MISPNELPVNLELPAGHRLNTTGRNRQGVVLFIVVIVIALVSLSSYGFVVLTQTEFRAARIRGDQLQVKSVADSGWEYMASYASSSRFRRFAIGGLEDNPSLFKSVVVDVNDAFHVGRFSIVTPGMATSRMTAESAGAFQFGMINESSKLPLALVLEWDHKTPGAGRTALMRLPAMTEVIADAILDWIDADDEPREFGAEYDVYETMDPQREPANQLPTRIDELLQVRGVSRGLLFGRDIDRNYRVEQHEQPQIENDQPSSQQLGQGLAQQQQTTQRQVADEIGASDVDDELPRPWAHFLTAYAAERNVNAHGQPRINLNGDDLAVLHKQLEEAFDSDVANFIVALRIEGPYKGSKPGIQGTITQPSLTSTPKFEIESTYSVVKSKIAQGTEENLTVFDSPFTSSFGRGNLDVARFLDGVTDSAAPLIENRININLARLETLMAIPGMSAETAERIVVATSSGSDESDSRYIHPYWLVESQVIDEETFEQISPFLTVGGDVFSAQIVAFYDEESPWCRFETTIDATDSPPRKLYYGLLNHLGRGFTIDELID